MNRCLDPDTQESFKYHCCLRKHKTRSLGRQKPVKSSSFSSLELGRCMREAFVLEERKPFNYLWALFVYPFPIFAFLFPGNFRLIQSIKYNSDQNIEGHERETLQWNDLCSSKMQRVCNDSFAVFSMGEVISLMDSLSPLQKDWPGLWGINLIEFCQCNHWYKAFWFPRLWPSPSHTCQIHFTPLYRMQYK